jgi:hypothetical protein
MIFKDLITQLKKVKSENDITEELAINLTSEAISACMTSFLNEYEDIEPDDAFDMTRASILRQLDMILLTMAGKIELPDDFDMESDQSTPAFGDSKLHDEMAKVIESYNLRVEK